MPPERPLGGHPTPPEAIHAGAAINSHKLLKPDGLPLRKADGARDGAMAEERFLSPSLILLRSSSSRAQGMRNLIGSPLE